MKETIFRHSVPTNEPVRHYIPGSAETESIKAKLESLTRERVNIPCVIDGCPVETAVQGQVRMPHERKHVLGDFHLAGEQELQSAVLAARRAKPGWENASWDERAAVFLRAADLLAGPYRDLLNAATMLGQSKNVFQAEIDSACELIDFLRFNVSFYQEILSQQPQSSPGIKNWLEYRPLEGFVLAITPFNFTAIAGNLPTAPALLGNTVIWKPSHTQMLSAHFLMQLFEQAGLPPGVINMVGAEGRKAGPALLSQRDLAGVHFTGSTATFESIYRTMAGNISDYDSYPRIVGETGGKDFVFAHPSADPDALATALIRGAFEYQGQKCSAASRAYIPKSIWPRVKEHLVDEIQTIKMGDVRDFSNFVNAVIDDRSFKKIVGYLDHAHGHSEASILVGGRHDDSVGYFIEPTVIVTSDPAYRSMREEIFGPVLTVFVYDDANLEDTIEACNRGSPYALTGSVFARDRLAAADISSKLRHAAGNFYINDKPTGAVVGQQPFGGGRKSGTNDKAGSPLNLYRWLSPRTVKETYVPPTNYRYPFLG
jgi:1-pyrroline-5-carboxylate dehydrogenase